MIGDELQMDWAAIGRTIGVAKRVESLAPTGSTAVSAAALERTEAGMRPSPSAVGLAVEAINIVTLSVEVRWGLHVCYGSRYARPSWEGHNDFLFPAVLDANVDQLGTARSGSAWWTSRLSRSNPRKLSASSSGRRWRRSRPIG